MHAFYYGHHLRGLGRCASVRGGRVEARWCTGKGEDGCVVGRRDENKSNEEWKL